MKFIEWWWFTKLDNDERLGVTLCLLLGTSGLAGLIAGSFGVFLVGIVTSVVLVVLYFIGMHFLNSWREYKEAQEQEAQRILCRLKGLPELSDTELMKKRLRELSGVK